MTTAVYDNTTSRRDALRGMFATIIAGTGAAAGSADTRLITLCSQLATLQGEFDELLNRRDTIELEHATEHELAAIEAAGLPQTMLASWPLRGLAWPCTRTVTPCPTTATGCCYGAPTR